MNEAFLANGIRLELQRRSAHRAIATMCTGIGQGISIYLQRIE